MDDPFVDIDKWMRYLIFALIFGGWIFSTIFRNIVRPRKRPPPAVGPQGGPPAKGLREFLEEIRQEDAAGGKRPAPAEPGRQEQVLEWEEVAEAAPEPQRPAQPHPFEQRRADWILKNDERRRERARQREERARRLREAQNREAEEREAQEEAVREEARVRLAERHLDSKLDERQIGSHLDAQHLESRLAGSLRRRPADGARRRRQLTGALAGLTARELLLAELILGKPRAKKRHFRDT